MPYRGQLNQDRILDRAVFRGMRAGVFVDIGAHDGVKFSNTLFFERNLDWTGLCVEAHPGIFPALVANRRCPCANVAVSETTGPLDFMRVDSDQLKSTMFSGLVGALQPGHVEFVAGRLQDRGGHAEIVKVPGRRLGDVLAGHRIDEVHLLSVDVEGGELSVLRSLDFGAVTVHAAVVECNYAAPREVEVATGNRLSVVARSRQDMFLLNPASPFFASAPWLRRALLRDVLRARWRRWRKALRAALKNTPRPAA